METAKIEVRHAPEVCSPGFGKTADELNDPEYYDAIGHNRFSSTGSHIVRDNGNGSSIGKPQCAKRHMLSGALFYGRFYFHFELVDQQSGTRFLKSLLNQGHFYFPSGLIALGQHQRGELNMCRRGLYSGNSILLHKKGMIL